MSTDSYAYADGVIHRAMVSSVSGVYIDLAAEAVEDMLHAYRQIAKQMRETPTTMVSHKERCGCGRWVTVTVGPSGRDLALAAANIGKGLDEIVRLVQFVKGQPDSRPDGGRDSRDILGLLTDEQARQVQEWIEAAAVTRGREASRAMAGG